MSKYENIVKDHQDYSSVYGDTLEWVSGLKEKVSACADVSGDKPTVQTRLDKLQVSCCWILLLLNTTSFQLA